MKRSIKNDVHRKPKQEVWETGKSYILAVRPGYCRQTELGGVPIHLKPWRRLK